jgi:hypothetical protein
LQKPENTYHNPAIASTSTLYVEAGPENTFLLVLGDLRRNSVQYELKKGNTSALDVGVQRDTERHWIRDKPETAISKATRSLRPSREERYGMLAASLDAFQVMLIAERPKKETVKTPTAVDSR